MDQDNAGAVPRFAGGPGAAGVDSRHVLTFVRGMPPLAGIKIGATTQHGRALDIELPDDRISMFPEFGRRRHVTLAFDRQLARDRDGMFPVDFQSSLFQSLVAPAKDRAFDGLFASELQRTHGAKVKLTLEIEADATAGFADADIGVVSDNARQAGIDRLRGVIVGEARSITYATEGACMAAIFDPMRSAVARSGSSAR